MANTLLTTSEILRKSLMILHQKCNFVGNIFRGYDDKYAKEGAKIGDTLNIRLPNEYLSGDGEVITAASDTVERSIPLTINKRKWVAPEFTTHELTLSMDDFTDRVLEPAQAVLAAKVEADALTMSLDVAQQVGSPGSSPSTLITYLQAQARVTDSLGPLSKRCYHIKPIDMAVIVDSLKGLFQDSSAIASQYREGIMGKAAGGDWYQNTHMVRVTNGNKVAGVTVSGAGQSGSTLLLGGLAAADTFKKGQTFTITGVFEVHPETKVATNVLKPFVVTADVTSAGATLSVPIAPAIILTGGSQNVTAGPAAGAAVNVVGAANQSYGIGLHFYKDAFVLGTADLYIPKGVDMSGREEMDGISMRLVRDYEARPDKLITRLDVLYGYRTLREQLACRIASS